MLKEMLTHVFTVPQKHNKCKPFFDHVLVFSVADGRIWLRNYQVSMSETYSQSYWSTAQAWCI